MPATKRRRLVPAGSVGSQPQVSEPSFANVLARIHNEAGLGTGKSLALICDDIADIFALVKVQKVVQGVGQDLLSLLWMRRETPLVQEYYYQPLRQP